MTEFYDPWPDASELRRLLIVAGVPPVTASLYGLLTQRQHRPDLRREVRSILGWT